MKNKGFTLAELMGVIIILGIILLLTLPTIDKTIKNARQTAYDTQIDSIIKASSDWTLKNTDLLPNNDGDSITIYLAELKLSGGVDIDIKNPKTGKLMSNNTSIVITKSNNKYIYSVNVIDITSNEDSNAPILVIEGNVVDYVEVNQDGKLYDVPSATAKTSSGTAIPNSYISYQITKNDKAVSVIDTSTMGTYIVNYTVTYEEKNGNYQKTVIVRDTTKPEITIEGNLSTTASTMSINLLTGVTVIDNSGETIVPVVRSSVSNIPGTYTVSYTATDSSGNTITKKRDVIVYDE